MAPAEVYRRLASYKGRSVKVKATGEVGVVVKAVAHQLPYSRRRAYWLTVEMQDGTRRGYWREDLTLKRRTG